MANDSILIPGQTADIEEMPSADFNSNYLEIKNYLNEFQEEDQKSAARENLGVYSKEAVYTKEKVKHKINKAINEAINSYLNQEDPHGIIPQVEEMIEGMVKTDGSTPFTVPQEGVDPSSDNHLTTKRFVKKLLKDYIKIENIPDILDDVKELLVNYVQYSQTYLKKDLYNKDEINKLNKEFIKKDGSVAFSNPQLGIDPTIGSHLSTKRYVDRVMKEHLESIDPHGFITILNNRLANYAKKKDIFDKTETYSRTQIDGIIIKLVNEVVESSISDFMDSVNDKFEYFRKSNFIKQDGSVPFLNRQKGIAGEEPNDLVILEQLQSALDDTSSQITWKTSGPVESSVGFVEDNSPVPDVMTLQEIMDAIFYGKSISINAPEYVMGGEYCDITVCIHGSLSTITNVELWQGDQLCYVWDINTIDEFKNGCVTKESCFPITEDTEFKVKVHYSNETEYEASATVSCALPIFMGLLPKFKFVDDVTYKYLVEELLIPEPNNNKIFEYGNSFTINYEFKDSRFRQPFIMVPENFPYEIDSIKIQSQTFGKEAINVIQHLTLTLPNLQEPQDYTVYIYKEALSFANGQPITFNFKKNE